MRFCYLLFSVFTLLVFVARAQSSNVTYQVSVQPIRRVNDEALLAYMLSPILSTWRFTLTSINPSTLALAARASCNVTGPYTRTDPLRCPNLIPGTYKAMLQDNVIPGLIFTTYNITIDGSTAVMDDQNTISLPFSRTSLTVTLAGVAPITGGRASGSPSGAIPATNVSVALYPPNTGDTPPLWSVVTAAPDGRLTLYVPAGASLSAHFGYPGFDFTHPPVTVDTNTDSSSSTVQLPYYALCPQSSSVYTVDSVSTTGEIPATPNISNVVALPGTNCLWRLPTQPRSKVVVTVDCRQMLKSSALVLYGYRSSSNQNLASTCPAQTYWVRMPQVESFDANLPFIGYYADPEYATGGFSLSWEYTVVNSPLYSFSSHIIIILAIGLSVVSCGACGSAIMYRRFWRRRRDRGPSAFMVGDTYETTPGLDGRIEHIAIVPHRRRAPKPSLPPHLIRSLPTHTSKAGLDLPSDWVCAICMDETPENRASDTYKELPCKHIFHTACIDEWLGRDIHCPLCKDNVDAALKKTRDAGDIEMAVMPTASQSISTDTREESVPEPGTSATTLAPRSQSPAVLDNPQAIQDMASSAAAHHSTHAHSAAHTSGPLSAGRRTAPLARPPDTP